jgi:Sortase domain
LDDLWDPALNADLWHPVLDDDWWGLTPDAVRPDGIAAAGGAKVSAVVGANPGVRVSGPDVSPGVSPPGSVRPVVSSLPGSAAVPETPREAPAEPSWGRVLATTVTLWASRRMRGIGAGWRRGTERKGSSRFRWMPGKLRRASVPGPAVRRTAVRRLFVLRTSVGGSRLAALSSTAPGSRTRLVAASILGAGLLAVGAGTAGLVVASGSSAPLVRIPSAPSPVAAPVVRTVTPVWLETMQQTARPVWLTVPAIGVRAAVIDLGLNRNGTLQVPGSTTVVGWYTGSPRPGAIGSAVIAGHVDSRAGPGVFFWLRAMHRGQRIYVKRADGTLAVFKVTSVRMYAKDKFPTAAVYGPVPDAELRLITCGGTFDESRGTYLSNVVVFARLTG